MSVLTEEFCKYTYDIHPFEGQVYCPGIYPEDLEIDEASYKIDDFERDLKENDPQVGKIREEAEKLLKEMRALKDRMNVHIEQDLNGVKDRRMEVYEEQVFIIISKLEEIIKRCDDDLRK